MSPDFLKDIVVGALLLAGSFFLVVGAAGLIRMPDVFTRMHATSVSDTLGAGLLVLGMMVEAGFTLVTVKLLIILAIFFFASPLATHALARGALAAGVKPVLFDNAGRRRPKALELIDAFKLVQAVPQAPAGRKAAPRKAAPRRPKAARKPAGGKGGTPSKR